MANRLEEMRKARQERNKGKTTLGGALREFITAFSHENGGYDDERIEQEVAAIRAKQKSFADEGSIEHRVRVNDEQTRGYSRSRVMKATKGKPTGKAKQDDRKEEEKER